ncbi:hypothetical protein EVAR_46571_1 [Eumeta japonica]|uniref:Uncharacterized protein n=1 Tax=Eumeta variegata TaxID=151549 RepID=A0A4C1WT84_EUMVA|nr:hypothetical protein EVAR_46571_1 [Eumeta japonica]
MKTKLRLELKAKQGSESDTKLKSKSRIAPVFEPRAPRLATALYVLARGYSSNEQREATQREQHECVSTSSPRLTHIFQPVDKLKSLNLKPSVLAKNGLGCYINSVTTSKINGFVYSPGSKGSDLKPSMWVWCESGLSMAVLTKATATFATDGSTVRGAERIILI